MGPEGNHLRRQNETSKHQYHDRKQGLADGQPYVKGSASAGGEDASKDIPGKNHGRVNAPCNCAELQSRTLAWIMMNVSSLLSAMKS